MPVVGAALSNELALGVDRLHAALPRRTLPRRREFAPPELRQAEAAEKRDRDKESHPRAVRAQDVIREHVVVLALGLWLPSRVSPVRAELPSFEDRAARHFTSPLPVRRNLIRANAETFAVLDAMLTHARVAA